MMNRPLDDLTTTEFKTHFSDKHTRTDLADAYAAASNAFWWNADNIDDYEEDTPEYQAACVLTDEWAALMNTYKCRILKILTEENITIPQVGQIRVILPFMERYGYVCSSGWWLKEND